MLNLGAKSRTRRASSLHNPATKLFLKFAFLLSCGFGVTVILIRAQPYDDRALSTFLTPPEGCESPCFMGIRPGITQFDEAVEILRNSPFVAEVGETQDYPNRQQSISWTWTDSIPFLNSSTPNQLFSTRGNVGTMMIYTEIPFIQIWWTLGQPDWMQHYGTDAGMGLTIFGYSKHNLVVEVGVRDCNRLHILTSQIELSFQAGVASAEGLNPNDYDLNVTLDQFRNFDACVHPLL